MFIAQGFTFADRQLERSEILQTFQVLTAQPRKTWISAGTIKATHLEYSTLEGYTIESIATVSYDGSRFCWEINIDSYDKETKSKGASEYDFDLNWNKRRVFVWDGERYTIYFSSGNQAIVTENPSDLPVIVNGPLTAGVIPWGYGIYTYESLSAAESSAIEREVNGQKQVCLTLKISDAPEMAFTLDPAKNYAVLSCSVNVAGHLSIKKSYDDYQNVSGKWIPTNITIEQYDESGQMRELLSYDQWEITHISAGLPEAGFTKVDYENDTLVEYRSLAIDRPLLYYHHDGTDTDSLLQKKLEIESADDAQAKNCATVAMKYVSGKLGQESSYQELTKLISEPNKNTSLYALRQFAQELGYYCLALGADIETLKNLQDCQAILHLPGANHYVVLEYIDDEYICLIDLDSNKFYYRTELGAFGLQWSKGTALLISKEPLSLEGNYTELSDEELHKIMGSTISFSNFACTEYSFSNTI